MDATTGVLLAALLGAVVGGAGVFAWHVSEHQQHGPSSKTPRPAVPPEVATVLAVLRSSGVIIDEDDRVIKASAPAYAMGLVRGTELLSPDLCELVSEVRSDGQIRENEFTISRAGSAERNVLARVAPLGSRHILLLVDDRTRERRIEAVRRDFVANVSHELKTPVGAIRVLADAVSDASDDPEAVKRFAARMLIESDRLTELVQQIIELSRLQGDEPLDHPVPVEVDEVVAAAVDTVSVDASEKHITVSTAGAHGLHVFGNEEQVTMAVTNLVANAVNYSGAGSTVTVIARAANGAVDIAVTDEGIGIPQNEIDRIFERFYRVDPARHRSTGGTGLGLSIVKHVAATHGGEVRVRSVEGEGSTFTLTLPQYVMAEAEQKEYA